MEEYLGQCHKSRSRCHIYKEADKEYDCTSMVQVVFKAYDILFPPASAVEGIKSVHLSVHLSVL